MDKYKFRKLYMMNHIKIFQILNKFNTQKLGKKFILI